MAKKRSKQAPTGRAAVDSARARIRRRTTKSPGLLLREKELKAARRELSNIRGTGVANNAQTRRAQAAVSAAERKLKRQQDTSRRTGGPTG